MDAADLDAIDGQVVAILVGAGRPCTAEQAGIIRARILGRKRLRDPAAYVAATCRKDPAAAFALCLGGPASTPNGRRPPAREVIAALGKKDPEIAHRGAALARRLLEAKAAGLTDEPEQPPDTDEEWPF